MEGPTNPEENQIELRVEDRSGWEGEEVLRVGTRMQRRAQSLQSLDLTVDDETDTSHISGEDDELSSDSSILPPVVSISEPREANEIVEETDTNDGTRREGRLRINTGLRLITILVCVGSLALVAFLWSISSPFSNKYAAKLKSLVSPSLNINSEKTSDQNRLKQNIQLSIAKKSHHAFAVTPSFNNFADIAQPHQNGGPVFFYRGGGIGGKYVVNIVSKCLGLSHMLHSGTTNPDWIETVNANVVSTYSLHKSSYLCSPAKPGKLFLLMRSPLVDAKQVYNEKKNPFSHYYDPRVTDMNFEEYVLSDFMPSSQMCRDICRQPHGELSSACIDDAKRFLQTKVLVGVFEWYEQSLDRFKQYFDWSGFSSEETKQCEDDQFWAVVNQFKTVEDLDPNSESYGRANEKLWQAQFCDMALYNYIKNDLFHQQGHLVHLHMNLR